MPHADGLERGLRFALVEYFIHLCFVCLNMCKSFRVFATIGFATAAISMGYAAEEAARPVATSAAAKSPFFFIIDYLPPAIYDRDSVTGCFRVENVSGADVKLDFVFTAYNDAGEVLKENTQPITAVAKGFTAFQGALDSRLAARMTFSLRKGADVLGSVALRLLRDEAPWPATRVRAGRIELAEGGDILLPTVTKRIRKQDRSFAPMKWILGKGDAAAVEVAVPSVVFTPGRWWVDEKTRGAPAHLGPYALNGSPPLLFAMNHILTQAPALLADDKRGPVQFVICLPPEDLDAATDPRVYRAILDGLLAHVARLPAKKIFVVPPFQFGAREKAAAALAHEVNAAAGAYGVVAVDPAEYLNEKLWRVDPEKEGVYGIRPNATGLKKIEQGLFNLIP